MRAGGLNWPLKLVHLRALRPTTKSRRSSSPMQRKVGSYITPQSPIRIPFSQLQPLGSERKRPGGFVLHWRRKKAAYPQDSQGFATFRRPSESLSRRRATRLIHTGGPPTSRFWPKLSAASLSRAAWVIVGLLSPNRSQPTGAGFRDRRQNEILAWVIKPNSKTK